MFESVICWFLSWFDFHFNRLPYHKITANEHLDSSQKDRSNHSLGVLCVDFAKHFFRVDVSDYVYKSAKRVLFD